MLLIKTYICYSVKKLSNASDLENKLMASGERMGERDSQGVWDGHVYTDIFKMDSQQGSTS